MTARTRPRGRKRGIVLLLIAALVVGGTVAASQLTTSTMLDPPTPQELPVARAGTAYCPVTAGEGDSSQLEIASASSDEDSTVQLTRFLDGQPQSDDPVGITAGGSLIVEVAPEHAGAPVAVNWRGGPVVVQYRLTPQQAGEGPGAGDQAVATCQSQPSDRWYLAGFDTTRGSRSTLYLFNPFEQDAVVSVQFGTEEGPVALVIADQIQVPAGQVVVRNLAELRPETADLAVTVQTQVGRVIPQGQVVRGPAGEGLEGITGRALLPAMAETSSELFIAEAVSDDVTESWVAVYNPADRAAAVQVQVSTPLGDASRLASELTVPAGGVARVELADLSALPRMGIRLESVNGIGLIATRVSAVQDGDRAGVSAALAAPVADTTWTIAGGRGADAELVLYNPGDVVASARIDLAGGAPSGFDAVEVPPNGVTSLSLAEVEGDGPAHIQADQPLVAGVVNLSPEVATAFWSATGTARATLLGTGEAITARRDPSLSSVPVLSATATPTPVPPAAVAPGEGTLDATPAPSLIPTPTVSPTASPGSEPSPGADPSPTTPAPTPTGDAEAPDPGADPDPDSDPSPGDEPSPGADPSPGTTATETEGSLFG